MYRKGKSNKGESLFSIHTWKGDSLSIRVIHPPFTFKKGDYVNPQKGRKLANEFKFTFLKRVIHPQIVNEGFTNRF